MATAIEHLWRQVSQTAAETTSLSIILDALFGQPKVSELCMAIRIDDHIVRLQVSENNVALVQTLNRKQHFTGVNFSPRLFELALQLQDLGKVPALAVLHDQVQFLIRLESVVQIHNEGVLDVGKHVALRLRVLDEIIADYLVLRLHFHRVEHARGLLSNEVNLTERTCPQQLHRLEMLRHYLLRLV